jgi:hypothetical protein
MQLGTAADLPIVAGIGRAWTWLAVAAWAAVFIGMCTTLAGSLARRGRARTTAAVKAADDGSRKGTSGPSDTTRHR